MQAGWTTLPAKSFFSGCVACRQQINPSCSHLQCILRSTDSQDFSFIGWVMLTCPFNTKIAASVSHRKHLSKDLDRRRCPSKHTYHHRACTGAIPTRQNKRTHKDPISNDSNTPCAAYSPRRAVGLDSRGKSRILALCSTEGCISTGFSFSYFSNMPNQLGPPSRPHFPLMSPCSQGEKRSSQEKGWLCIRRTGKHVDGLRID